MKKLISIALVLVMVAAVFVVPVSASSYPIVFFDTINSDATNVIPYGEIGTICFTVFREFNNEKLNIEVYDEAGYIVAKTTCSYSSADAAIINQKITINTNELELTPGEYTVKYWMDFYSYYEWHSAPNSYTGTFKVIKNVCNGKHNLVFKEHTIKADCKSDGYDKYKCTKCEFYKYKEIVGTHSYGACQKIDDKQHKQTCSVCSEVKTSNHRWDAGKITVKPTSTAAGKKVYTCKDCGYKKTTTIKMCASGSHVYSNSCDKECNKCGTVRSAIKHVAGGWIIDKKATVNAAGKQHKECKQCGVVLKTAVIKQLKCSAPKIKSAENTQSGIKITWGKVSGADKYKVYRSTSKSDGYKCIATVSGVSYTDKSAKSGKKYYFKVKAVNEAGDSASSSASSKLYLADPTIQSLTSTKSGVVVKWNKIPGAQGYEIYRKGSGSYSKIATVKGSTKISYTDKQPIKGKKYTYKVKAYYSKTTSAFSVEKSITDKY